MKGYFAQALYAEPYPGRGLTLGFAAKRFKDTFDQRCEFSGHQDKVSVKALGDVVTIDIVILLTQGISEFQAL